MRITPQEILTPPMVSMQIALFRPTADKVVLSEKRRGTTHALIEPGAESQTTVPFAGNLVTAKDEAALGLGWLIEDIILYEDAAMTLTPVVVEDLELSGEISAHRSDVSLILRAMKQGREARHTFEAKKAQLGGYAVADLAIGSITDKTVMTFDKKADARPYMYSQSRYHNTGIRIGWDVVTKQKDAQV